MFKRVRNPESATLKAVRAFENNPVQAGAKLARIARQESYEMIMPYVQFMYEAAQAANDKVSLGILTMLRQPEWYWCDCENDRYLRFFGFVAEDKFQAVGYYVTGRQETGETRVFETPGETAEFVVGDVCEDPREAYKTQSVRHKVYRSSNKYWVVAIGRIVDLVNAGVDRKDVLETNNKGYFKKVPAFARLKGPFADSEEAREARATL